MEISAHDLGTQYESISDEIDSAIRDVIDDTDFILGESVSEFEENFAQYCGTYDCVGVSSGTAALHLVFEALNIGENDEVITTPLSFISTVEPLLHLGAKPVFADIDPATYNIDPERVEDKITDRTRAILGVDLYGQPADFESLRELAHDHNLHLIEDAAQAHGARQNDRRAGSLGDVATFSFYPGKNLGAFGDAGCITTSDETLAERVRSLRDHGRTDRYAHSEPGFNFRMDGLQGAVLNVKLNHLDEWNKQRRSNADYYNNQLKNPPVQTPTVRSRNEHVFHQYVIQVEDRDQIQDYLNDQNISAGIHYPNPLHLQPSLESLNYEQGDFPIAEKACQNILSLPIHSMLDQEDLDFVISTLKSALDENSKNTNSSSNVVAE